jgi:Transposase IS4
VRSVTGDPIFEGGDAVGGDNRRTPYNYFMAIFPPDALMRIATLTSEKLREKGKQVTTGGEILKVFGIHILGTRYEFGSLADLWSTSSREPSSTLRRLGGKLACLEIYLTYSSL